MTLDLLNWLRLPTRRLFNTTIVYRYYKHSREEIFQRELSQSVMLWGDEPEKTKKSWGWQPPDFL